MNPKAIFRDLVVRIIAPELQALNYKRSNSNFILTSQNTNTGVINFQKSTKSTSELIIFTVNIGVCSSRLITFFNHQRRSLDIWDCQLRLRLGWLMEEKGDLWWNIDSNTDADVLGRTICDSILAFGVNEIVTYISDSALRDLWVTGRSPGLTKIERLMYLSVLLKDLGPVDILQQIIQEMEVLSSQTHSPILTAHIERLRSL
jgi:hypothetical protein